MILGSTRHLVYSSWDGSNQCLWIGATTVGNAVKISTPTLAWERCQRRARCYLPRRMYLDCFTQWSGCAGTVGRLELTGSNRALGPSTGARYSLVQMGITSRAITDSSRVPVGTRFGMCITHRRRYLPHAMGNVTRWYSR